MLNKVSLFNSQTSKLRPWETTRQVITNALLRSLVSSNRWQLPVRYYYFIIIKVFLLGIFSVHTPGYKNDLNCSFNQFTWVVTHHEGIKGSDLLGFDIPAVKNRIKGKNTAIPVRLNLYVHSHITYITLWVKSTKSYEPQALKI